MWQDYVLTAGSIIFILALIPAIFADHKPPRSTCATTAAVLYVFAFTEFTLNLYFASLTTLATAACWTVLLLQKKA